MLILLFLFGSFIYVEFIRYDLSLEYNDEEIEIYQGSASEDAFVDLLFKNEIQTVPLGGKIEFRIDEKVKKIEVFDYLLEDDGKMRYKGLDSESIDIIKVQEEFRFIINENKRIYMSSQKEELVYRGIELKVETEEGDMTFLFIIETPAYKNQY